MVSRQQKALRFKSTPDFLDGTILTEPYEIMVFGSNTEGIHKSGSAKTAMDHFGAKFGVPMGLQGRSYAIITKDFYEYSRGGLMYKKNMLALISSQVFTLYKFAQFRPDLHFYVTKVGTGLAGFQLTEIDQLFAKWESPRNVILPKDFYAAKHV